MDVLVAYANQKGWMTAKAGRPDVNRAGNARKFCYFDLVPNGLWLLFLCFCSVEDACGR